MQKHAKTNLIGLNRDDLTKELEFLGEKPFRVKQLWHWLYFRGVTNFDAMTTLSKALRHKLTETHVIKRPEIVTEQFSNDGTRKWLLKSSDENAVETVFIPEKDRGALCISSQVGCTLNCSFCHTGTQRLIRNLTACEILGQMMVARDTYGEWSITPSTRKISNIVMMGMGEPLFNFDEVAKALKIIMDPEGLAISKRRITLSTSGVVPMIKKVGEELGVGLAISMHAVRDDLRNQLVPINKKYPIDQLLAACRTYPGASSARRITFEYVMLDNVNDSPEEARELARLLKGIHAKVNLIPFNKWPGAKYRTSPSHVIKRFSKILNDNKISAPIRVPRGRDIMAACGQLKSAKDQIDRLPSTRTDNTTLL